MLERRDHDRAVVRARRAEHRERVRFAAAARPHDVAACRRIAERGEQARARGLDVAARGGALRMLRARVAPGGAHHLGHQRDHLIGDAGRGGIVEVDWLHHRSRRLPPLPVVPQAVPVL